MIRRKVGRTTFADEPGHPVSLSSCDLQRDHRDGVLWKSDGETLAGFDLFGPHMDGVGMAEVVRSGETIAVEGFDLCLFRNRGSCHREFRGDGILRIGVYSLDVH